MSLFLAMTKRLPGAVLGHRAQMSLSQRFLVDVVVAESVEVAIRRLPLLLLTLLLLLIPELLLGVVVEVSWGIVVSLSSTLGPVMIVTIVEMVVLLGC